MTRRSTVVVSSRPDLELVATGQPPVREVHLSDHTLYITSVECDAITIVGRLGLLYNIGHMLVPSDV